MKQVPIVILAYDSVILRAYLSIFKEMNIQPEKIVVVLFNKLPQQKSKLLASYLPNPIKNNFLQRAIDKKMNYYPRFIKNIFPKTFASIAKVLQEHYSFSPSFLESIDSQVPYKEFSEDITFLSIADYKDKKFIDFINRINTKTLFLYTGGGILPASAFNNSLVKYLHVHPGYLPFVRGADCYLWSILLHNKIGASSFFMSAGIVERDPFASLDQGGVGELIKFAVQEGRKTNPELKLGVCGEHGGDPLSINFFEKKGLDYVSCSPYRIPIARLSAAKAAIGFGRISEGMSEKVA